MNLNRYYNKTKCKHLIDIPFHMFLFVVNYTNRIEEKVHFLKFKLTYYYQIPVRLV